MNLRAATEKDLFRVMSWISDPQECKLWAGPYVSFPLVLDSLITQISYKSENSFCLEKNDEVIAFGQLIKKSRRRFHFARILVHPDKRGSGYGRELCRGLIDKALSQHCDRITLNVYRNNKAAKKLYEYLGFEERRPPSKDYPSEENCFMVFHPPADMLEGLAQGRKTTNGNFFLCLRRMLRF